MSAEIAVKPQESKTLFMVLAVIRRMTPEGVVLETQRGGGSFHRRRRGLIDPPQPQRRQF